MLKKILITLLMISPYHSFAQENMTENMTLEMLLDLNAAAMGGKEQLENIHSVKTKISLIENGTTMEGHYWANRDGQMRVDIYVGGSRVFTEALSSKTAGWQQNGEGEPVEPLSEKGLAALQHSIISNLYTLHEWPALGFNLQYVGLQDMMGKPYHTIDITRPTGIRERMFFDLNSYLLSGTMDETALHVDIDPTEKLKLNTKTDYKSVNGIMRAFGGEVIEVKENNVVQVFELHEIEFNPSIDPNVFLNP